MSTTAAPSDALAAPPSAAWSLPTRLISTFSGPAAIDFIYLSPQRRAIPVKFLIPGTVFLLAFQIAPILYNVNVAFTNWSTGHILQKDEAIEGIKRVSLAP